MFFINKISKELVRLIFAHNCANDPIFGKIVVCGFALALALALALCFALYFCPVIFALALYFALLLEFI